MDRLKTFLIYVLILVAIYIISDILIFIGLNVNYKPIENKIEIPKEISIKKAEATLVNGRIYGEINNNTENNVNGKYIKVDIYSSKDKLLGTEYLTINNISNNTSENFNVYFKAEDAKYYNIDIVDNIEENTEKNDIFLSEDLKTTAVISLLVYMMIF